jgi:prophage maintenance system killer protein
MDLDTALVTLWDAGVESVLRPGDLIPSSKLNDAREALGLMGTRDIRTVDGWLSELKISRHELTVLLAQAGKHLSNDARRLPKGSVSVLRRHQTESVAALQVRSERASKAATTPSEPLARLEWITVGKPRADMKYLEFDDVKSIHQQLFDDFLASDDPIDTPGTRSDDLLASACARPQTCLGDVQKYPSVEMAASALAHSVVNNHPFWNGNKRAALVAYLVFLDNHNLAPTCSDDELFKFILKVSQHSLVERGADNLADREVLAMADWTRTNTRVLKKGERTIKWHALRRLLSELGCTSEPMKNVGNRIAITREVERKGRLPRSTRTEVLRTQVQYGDEGREVNKDALRKLRLDLELDEAHGFDSAAFYESEVEPVGGFILRYRRILRRLAKL